MLGPEQCWFQKNFGSKNFWFQKILIQNILGPKTFWGPKKFPVQKDFGSKKVWV